MNFFVIYCIESLIYPPGGPILLLLAGLLVHQHWHRFSLALISHLSQLNAIIGIFMRLQGCSGMSFLKKASKSIRNAIPAP
ncbi:MAG: hypothetical protein D3916_07145 [Candidatus Electrothrix sp. MAN1_4]|nr:hypothetical protein [Candidatus Electrothrix sp. MAN1_4]